VNFVQNPTYDAGLEARFRVAARHSRMVRILRVAVPGAVLLSMAAVVGVSIFNPFRMMMPKLPVDIGNLVVSGTKITMETPHLAGFSADKRPTNCGRRLRSRISPIPITWSSIPSAPR
jgi:lipopolysaccharide export system protein LptC